MQVVMTSYKEENMKYLLWAIGVPMGLAIAFLVVQTLASERVEVVELTTIDEADEPQTTRLWVMDDEGFQYLRVGADGSGWFSRILQNGEVQVRRGDTTNNYTVQQRPEKSEKINAMMQEKYTWGDSFFAIVLGSRDGSIPLELHPVN
jgi:predicted outer membrane lipoprotein